MQRWHLTMGLAATALGAAFLVPDIMGTPRGGDPAPLRPGVGAPMGTDEAASGRLHLTASLDQSAVLANSGSDRYLVLEISADSVEGDERRPVHLSVVMDTSGSMSSRGKLRDARAAAQELVGLLGPEDFFSLVTFDDQASVVFPSRRVDDPDLLKRRIGQIRTGGGTNLHAGLEAGLHQAAFERHDGVRRVVVLSDGNANIGITDPQSLRLEAGSMVRDGITVSAMGLGVDYNEDLLAAMADAGGGAYRFVDHPGTLAGLFTEELQQLSTVVAHQTALSLAVPHGVQIQEVYGYDLSATDDGYSVFLGDLYAGQTKKLVARVRVPDHQTGSVDVVTARLHHVDADTRATHARTAHVQATVTRDREMVHESVVVQARKQAVQARVGQHVDEAARTYAAGDLASNQASMDEAIELMETFSADFEDDEMLDSLGYVHEQKDSFATNAPSSEGGRANVKRAKESARAYAR
jgi:Ca-activated chloride channel family protein